MTDGQAATRTGEPTLSIAETGQGLLLVALIPGLGQRLHPDALVLRDATGEGSRAEVVGASGAPLLVGTIHRHYADAAARAGTLVAAVNPDDPATCALVRALPVLDLRAARPSHE